MLPPDYDFDNPKRHPSLPFTYYPSGILIEDDDIMFSTGGVSNYWHHKKDGQLRRKRFNKSLIISQCIGLTYPFIHKNHNIYDFSEENLINLNDYDKRYWGYDDKNIWENTIDYIRTNMPYITNEQMETLLDLPFNKIKRFINEKI